MNGLITNPVDRQKLQGISVNTKPNKKGVNVTMKQINLVPYVKDGEFSLFVIITDGDSIHEKEVHSYTEYLHFTRSQKCSFETPIYNHKNSYRLPSCTHVKTLFQIFQ